MADVNVVPSGDRKFCGTCGQPQQVDGNYCSDCGAALNAPIGKAKGRMPRWVLVALAVAITMVTALTVYSLRPEPRLSYDEQMDQLADSLGIELDPVSKLYVSELDRLEATTSCNVIRGVVNNAQKGTITFIDFTDDMNRNASDELKDRLMFCTGLEF